MESVITLEKFMMEPQISLRHEEGYTCASVVARNKGLFGTAIGMMTLVHECSLYSGDIFLRHSGGVVNAKDVTSVLIMSCRRGDCVDIMVEGTDERAREQARRVYVLAEKEANMIIQ